MKPKISFAHIIAVLFFFSTISCDDEKPNLTGDAAIYIGRGVWDDSQTAATNMFKWIGKSVALIDANYINNNSLHAFKIICIPGGDFYSYALDISENGKEKIRAFVRNGGGYIGLCGGGYFASQEIYWQGSKLPINSLKLFDGKASGTENAIVPYPERNMCEIIIDTTDEITSAISSPQWMLYYWGAVFTPNSSNIKILGKYNAVNKPAMIAFEYGSGKVFIIGTHPEIEEDSDRDGVVLEDTTINNVRYLGENQLDDKGSDWELMKNVVRWLMR